MSTLDYHLLELEVARNKDDQRRQLPDLPNHFESILDIGCGIGQTLTTCNLKPGTIAWGVDVDEEALAYGRKMMPHINFARACGERLPFPNQSFDVVISRVALPYMDLATAFPEIARVLKPGGQVWFTLHPLSMIARDFAQAATGTKLKNVAYLSYVLLNGLCFHLTGKLFRYPLKSDRLESFQTVSGVTKAMSKAGFQEVRTRKESLFMADEASARKQSFFVVLARKTRSGINRGVNAVWVALHDTCVELCNLLADGCIPLEFL